MTTPALTRDQCRELDRRATTEFGIPSMVLMENAGRGCVDVLERLGIDGPVAILCGKGNNAGDGFVIARHLEIRGYECRVLLLCAPRELSGDSATNYALLQKSGARIIDLSPYRAGPRAPSAAAEGSAPGSKPLDQQLTHHAHGAAWLVDAMLGTGARGEPRPPFDAAIDWMNGQACKKLAVDVPSGLDCDTGEPATHTIRADHMCTFATMKVGFTQPTAKPFIGTIHICDIGVSPRLFSDARRS